MLWWTKMDFHTCCCPLQNQDRVFFTMGKSTSSIERFNHSFCLGITCNKLIWSRKEWGLMASTQRLESSSCNVLLAAKQSDFEVNKQTNTVSYNNISWQMPLHLCLHYVVSDHCPLFFPFVANTLGLPLAMMKGEAKERFIQSKLLASRCLK